MPTVLVVDDSRIDQRLVGSLLEKTPKLEIEFASNGVEALERIKSNPPDLVITDLFMPEMDGMQLLAEVGRADPLVPVVLMTGNGSDEIAVEAVRSGARAYVPKTSLSRLLPNIVEQLLTLCREKRELSRFLRSVTESETTFVVQDNDTQLIAHLLEYVSGCMRNAGVCEEGTEDLICLGLEEALRNAIHHGNLELSSELREMEDDDLYNNAMAERRRTPPYCYRKVYVKMSISGEGAKFVVRDEGPGFDPSKLPDPTDPENLEAVCGRGVWLMRSLMDEVIFNDRGNEVTLIKKAKPLTAESN
jgi:CheY-like chemotaxis protein/anti-sigma regulatory factor (Ser/Thr protein kinase)